MSSNKETAGGLQGKKNWSKTAGASEFLNSGSVKNPKASSHENEWMKASQSRVCRGNQTSCFLQESKGRKVLDQRHDSRRTSHCVLPRQEELRETWSLWRVYTTASGTGLLVIIHEGRDNVCRKSLTLLNLPDLKDIKILNVEICQWHTYLLNQRNFICFDIS